MTFAMDIVGWLLVEADPVPPHVHHDGRVTYLRDGAWVTRSTRLLVTASDQRGALLTLAPATCRGLLAELAEHRWRFVCERQDGHLRFYLCHPDESALPGAVLVLDSPLVVVLPQWLQSAAEPIRVLDCGRVSFWDWPALVRSTRGTTLPLGALRELERQERDRLLGELARHGWKRAPLSSVLVHPAELPLVVEPPTAQAAVN